MSAQPGPGYRAEIDGLRALAVGGVVVHHTGLGLVPGGFTGVDVFFVISGFLITGIISGEMAAGRFSQWRFLERRVRRIVPAFAAMLWVTAVAGFAILTPEDFRPFAQSLTAASLFASNLLFTQGTGYFDSEEGMLPLLHTWTLGVEEQFYLIFPVMLLLCRRWRPQAVLPMVGLLAILSYAVGQGLAVPWPQGAFYLLPTRLWEFAVGTACALLPMRPAPRGWAAFAGLALIVLGYGLIHPETPAPGPMFLLPTLGTALVILFAAPANAAGRLLAWRPFVWLGLVSFGTYLWHQPLLVFAHYVWFGPLPLLATGALVAGSVGMGALSYHLLEQPVRAKRLLASRRSLLAVCGLALAIPAAAGFAGHLRAWLPASAEEARKLGALRPDVHDTPQMIPATGPLAFVLFGDSHAAQYNTALTERFGKGALLSFPSCLAAPGVSDMAASEPDAAGCAAMPGRLAELVRARGVRTIVWAQIWDRDLFAAGSDTRLPLAEGVRRLESGMQRLADRMPAGTRIILIGNVPTAWRSAPQNGAGWLRCRAYRNVACPTDFAAEQAQGTAINARLRDLAARDARFIYVDSAAPLCPGGRCRVVQEGMLNYWDQHHLTTTAARRVVARLPDLP
jgi:peptidoglycan/LPS O-acetylase OafA/YrhL